MLRGYRLLVFAACIGLAFISFGLGAMLVASDAQEKRYAPYRYATDKPEEVDPSLARIADAKPFEYRTPCKKPKGKDESDLCAQWRAAYAAEDSASWAQWGFWIATAGTIGLFWTLYYTRKAVEDTGDATRAMLRQNELAELANRAWLDINVRINNFAMFSESCIDFSIIINNVGHGVACDVKTHYKFFINTSFLGEGAQDFFEDCSEKAESGFNCVPPGSEQEIRLQYRTNIKVVDGERYVPNCIWIAVCATYGTSKNSLRWEQVNRAAMIAIKLDDKIIEEITSYDVRHGRIITLPVTPLPQVWHFDKPESQKPGKYA